MKNILSLITFVVAANVCVAQTDSTLVADIEVYQSMASDMCGCFNTATAGLSEEGRKVIEEAGRSDKGIQAVLMEYAERNPEQAAADGEVLTNMGGEDLMKCIEGLEEKYSDIYSVDSEDEVESNIIGAMSKLEVCWLSLAFMKAGS